MEVGSGEWIEVGRGECKEVGRGECREVGSGEWRDEGRGEASVAGSEVTKEAGSARGEGEVREGEMEEVVSGVETLVPLVLEAPSCGRSRQPSRILWVNMCCFIFPYTGEAELVHTPGGRACVRVCLWAGAGDGRGSSI